MSTTSTNPLRPPALPLYDAIMKKDDEHPDEIIRSIINEITNKVCNQNKISGKTVRFSEDTKNYDGPKLYKQITEIIIYSFFEKKIIQSSYDIKYLLNKKYGDINKETLTDAKNLMNNLLERLKQISSYDANTNVNLFKDMTGSHGLKLRKVHEPWLKRLITMFTHII